jgi:hypothetical protein
LENNHVPDAVAPTWQTGFFTLKRTRKTVLVMNIKGGVIEIE